jgi:hypothetical protein
MMLGTSILQESSRRMDKIAHGCLGEINGRYKLDFVHGWDKQLCQKCISADKNKYYTL